MKNYNKILTEKRQKISALSSGKIGKYEYLTSEEILPSDQRRVIEKAMFTYSPLRKIKMIEDHGKKQTKKQLKSMEKNWLNLMNLLEEITLISTEMAYHLKNRKYLVNFLNKGFLKGLDNSGNKSAFNDLI